MTDQDLVLLKNIAEATSLQGVHGASMAVCRAYFRTPGAGSGAVCAERAGNSRGCWRGCTGAVNPSLFPAWQVVSVASAGVGGEDVPGLSSRRGCLCGSPLLGPVGMVFGQVVTLWEQRDVGGAQSRGLGTWDGHADGHADELWGDGGFVGASR